LFSVDGIIQYRENSVVAWIDSEIGAYYRSLLPRAWYVKPPKEKSHVSIIRVFERPEKKNWGLYDGCSICITYYPSIQTDDTYYWLDCYSDEIGFVRRSLLLSTFRDTDYRYPIYDRYHITIANTK
jgi:hypothetical protein